MLDANRRAATANIEFFIGKLENVDQVMVVSASAVLLLALLPLRVPRFWRLRSSGSSVRRITLNRDYLHGMVVGERDI